MQEIRSKIERVRKEFVKKQYNVYEFSHGDIIEFTDNSGLKCIGEIKTIDIYGGGIWYTVCPSFDIETTNGILYKHVPITDVFKVNNRL